MAHPKQFEMNVRACQVACRGKETHLWMAVTLCPYPCTSHTRTIFKKELSGIMYILTPNTFTQLTLYSIRYDRAPSTNIFPHTAHPHKSAAQIVAYKAVGDDGWMLLLLSSSVALLLFLRSAGGVLSSGSAPIPLPSSDGTQLVSTVFAKGKMRAFCERRQQDNQTKAIKRLHNEEKWKTHMPQDKDKKNLPNATYKH